MSTHRKPYGVLSAETRDWDILDWLNQGEIWRDNEGRFLYMEEFEDDHLENLIAWLERKASTAHAYELHRYHLSGIGVFGPMGDAAQDAYEQGLNELMDMPPAQYIASKPLYRALRAEQDRRALARELCSPSGYGTIQVGEPGIGKVIFFHDPSVGGTVHRSPNVIKLRPSDQPMPGGVFVPFKELAEQRAMVWALWRAGEDEYEPLFTREEVERLFGEDVSDG